MPFVVKAALTADAGAVPMSFTQKTMYRGKTVAAGDEIFVFASEHNGGDGLRARGVVTSATRGEGIWVSIEVKPTAMVKRRFGRAELKPFRGRDDGRPETELDFKFYRQATNKIGGISDAAAAFLATFF